MWLLPFRVLRSRVMRLATPSEPASAAGRPTPKRIAWAVTAAGRYVPAATCLTLALAAYTLVKREGYPATLCLGVGKGENGALEAHAWVESAGKIIIGGKDSPERFRLLIPPSTGDYERDSRHILFG
jgi:hypothetical protein